MWFHKLLTIYTCSLLFMFVSSKEVSGVFTSIDSIVPASSSGYGPFDFNTVKVSWTIDTSKIDTGDTFSLNMPYIFEVRITNADNSLTNFFDIKNDDGTTLASCNVDQAGGRSLETSINCQVTADLTDFTTFSGSLQFVMIGDGGGLPLTIPAAEHWTAGVNQLVFNGDLTHDITFKQPGMRTLGRVTMRGDVFHYYMPKEELCPLSGIKNGTLGVIVKSQSLPINTADSNMYYTNTFSPYDFPLEANTIPDTTSQYTSSANRLDYSFGAVPVGGQIYWSGFVDNVAQEYSSYEVMFSLNYDCYDNSEEKIAGNYATNFVVVPGNLETDGSGNRMYTMSLLRPKADRLLTYSSSQTGNYYYYRDDRI